jgi:hypothetical protein
VTQSVMRPSCSALAISSLTELQRTICTSLPQMIETAGAGKTNGLLFVHFQPTSSLG